MPRRPVPSIPAHGPSKLKWVNESRSIKFANLWTAQLYSMEHYSAYVWLISLRLPVLERVIPFLQFTVYQASPFYWGLSGSPSKLATPTKIVPLYLVQLGPGAVLNCLQIYMILHFYLTGREIEMIKWVERHLWIYGAFLIRNYFNSRNRYTVCPDILQLILVRCLLDHMTLQYHLTDKEIEISRSKWVQNQY